MSRVLSGLPIVGPAIKRKNTRELIGLIQESDRFRVDQNPELAEYTAAQFIGLSLSFCIKDMAARRIPEKQVLGIVTATNIRNKGDLETVIAEYSGSYWNPRWKGHEMEDVPDSEVAGFIADAGQMALRLFEEGRILQPRVILPNRKDSGILQNGPWLNVNEQRDTTGPRMLELADILFRKK